MPLIESQFARRSFAKLAVGGATVTLSGMANLASSSAMAAMPKPTGMGGIQLSPEEQLEFLVRFMGSLKEEDCTWYYCGRLFAQIGENAPQPLFGLVGAETYWVTARPDGTYLLSASTFSYATELDSDKPLLTYNNPFTGEVNTPRPNLYRNDEASILTKDGMVHGPGLAPDPYHLSITRIGDTITVVHDVGQSHMPQPHRELSTKFVSAKDFYNSKIKNLFGTAGDVFVSKWPSWMNMGDRPGHTLWNVAAAKIKSHDELPPTYLNRILAEHPTHLSAKPGTKGVSKQVYQ